MWNLGLVMAGSAKNALRDLDIGPAEYIFANQRDEASSGCQASLEHSMRHYAAVSSIRLASEGLVVSCSEDATVVGYINIKLQHMLYIHTFAIDSKCRWYTSYMDIIFVTQNLLGIERGRCLPGSQRLCTCPSPAPPSRDLAFYRPELRKLLHARHPTGGAPSRAKNCSNRP